jgi:hypothetical protein
MKAIEEIKKITGDYKPGDSILLLGQTGVGKTYYMVWEAIYAALNKKNVLIYNSETDGKTVLKKVYTGIKNSNHKNKNSDLNIIVKEIFPGQDDKLFFKVKNSIELLKRKNKKPDIIFFEMVNLNTQTNEIERLRQFALSEKITIFFTSQLALNYCGNIGKDFTRNISFDFIFHLEREHKINTSKGIDEIIVNIPIINKNSSDIRLKTFFDYSDVTLKLETLIEDKNLYDLANCFQNFSVVAANPSELGKRFLVNIADIYSKLGMNTLYLSNNINAPKSFFKTLYNWTEESDTNVFNQNLGQIEFLDKFTSVEKILLELENEAISRKNLNCIIIDDFDELPFDDISSLEITIRKLYNFSSNTNIKIIILSKANSVKNKEPLSLHNLTNTFKKTEMADFIIGLEELSCFFCLKKNYRKAAVLKSRNPIKFNHYLIKLNKENEKIKIVKTFNKK